MKGIITDYIDKKGFGFIKDENEEKRFFHISDLMEKEKFLNNIEDYYFTNWIERKCYIVSFIPGENTKGLTAESIHLTNQIFDDKSQRTSIEVLITDFKYYSQTLTRVVSGIKQGDSIPFGTTRGGNGTYRIGYPESFRELNIHFRRIDDIGWGTIEVRNLVLDINGRSKITNQLVETLKDRLIGVKIFVTPVRDGWMLNEDSILKL